MGGGWNAEWRPGLTNDHNERIVSRWLKKKKTTLFFGQIVFKKKNKTKRVLERFLAHTSSPLTWPLSKNNFQLDTLVSFVVFFFWSSFLGNAWEAHSAPKTNKVCLGKKTHLFRRRMYEKKKKKTPTKLTCKCRSDRNSVTRPRLFAVSCLLDHIQ